MTYGGLDNVLGSGGRPRDGSRIPLSKHGDRVTINDELAVLNLDSSFEASVDGIILEHVYLHHVVQKSATLLGFL